AGVELVAAAAVLPPGSLDLLDRVHREAARPVEPALVARPVEELQEGVAVAGRAVAEARALRERPRPPRQLAARLEQGRQLLVARRERGERRHDPGPAVAPLRAELRRLPGLFERRPPLGHAAVPEGVARDRLDRPALQLTPPVGLE